MDEFGDGALEGLSPSGVAAMTTFLDDLRAMADVPAPAPSDELAALLGGAVPLGAAAGSSRRAHARRARVVVGVASAVIVVGTGAAAATGNLPQPAQRVVSRVVDHYTPFSIPAVSDDGPARTSAPPSPPPHRHPAAPVPPTPPPGEDGPGHVEGGVDEGDGRSASTGTEPGDSPSAGVQPEGGDSSDGRAPAGSGSTADGAESEPPEYTGPTGRPGAGVSPAGDGGQGDANGRAGDRRLGHGDGHHGD